MSVWRFDRLIDRFIDEMNAEGRFNSPSTDRAYRGTLLLHAEDVSNRDPRTTNREDVKRTLRRWSYPNTVSLKRAHMKSFYRWMVQEGMRKDNPAEQTRPPRRRKTVRYRLTRDESIRLLEAATSFRERVVAYVGVGAGLRRQEFLRLQGRHFAREDWVHVSRDIGKGGRERWIPLLADVRPVADEIRARVGWDEYVLPAQRWRDPGVNSDRRDYAKRPSSPQALFTLVRRLGVRAGIPAEIGPHTLRHAFADHIARGTGDARIVQALLGHADIGTTDGYMSEPTLDELRSSVAGVMFGVPSERVFSPLREWAFQPVEAPTRIELVEAPIRAVERKAAAAIAQLFLSPVLRAAAREMV